MASVLTHNMGDIKKVTFFMEECKRAGIPVLGPSVNESNFKFKVNDKGQIRFGMGAIKGVGNGAVDAIVAEREENGPYVSIFGFASRLDLRTVNKKNFEGLALAGAFDQFEGIHRAQYFAEDERGQTLIEMAIKYGNAVREAANSSQASLFGESEDADIPEPPIPPALEWRTLDQLNREKEVVGVYISGHPLDDFKFELEQFSNMQVVELEDIENLKKRRECNVAGIITSVSHLTTKTGSPFGKFVLEDYSGAFEFALFKDDYVKFRNYLNDYWFVLVTVKLDSWYSKRDQKEVFRTSVARIQLLSELREKMVKKLNLNIPLHKLDENLVDAIEDLLKKNKGKVPVQVNVKEDDTIIEMPSRSMKVEISRELSDTLDKMPQLQWSID
jgi:DNA polymerase-3 subunit alpha